MMGDFAFAQNQIEFCPNEVLQHCANIGSSAGIFLNFQRLIQEVLDIRMERTAGVKLKPNLYFFGSATPAGFQSNDFLLCEKTPRDAIIVKNLIRSPRAWFKAAQCFDCLAFHSGEPDFIAHVIWSFSRKMIADKRAPSIRLRHGFAACLASPIAARVKWLVVTN